MAHCLQALLTAELTDNEGWELLIKLSENLGYDELAKQFQTALDHEAEHLQNVRTWVSECVLPSAEA